MEGRVLVTGIGGPAGRSALGFFMGKGCELIGTDVREVEETPHRFHTLPLVSDPAFASELLALVEKERPGLFVPTVTEELVLAAELAPEIRALGAEVFISGARAAEVANDKLKTVRFFESTSVAVPRTFTHSEPRVGVIEALGLPLLAKPVCTRGGRGVMVHSTAADAEADDRDGIIFQEFIPGAEFDGNLFVEEDGGITASVILEKTELKEGLTGNAASVERVERPDIEDFCARVVGELGLTGPLDIDVRLREDGTPVLLEINARLGGNVLSAPEVLEALYKAWKKKGGSEKNA